ncbi:CgeB family protein [Nitratireductor thuwali]|uniref:Spore protein YkvP/CgeB glycosyl transferase-like domain-containing protein n=1 Tax=Nitratireductor thuwali TaxID=2267699 RepID=A0ABY5MHW7_9HYPH|nr:hypothetical protein NTH_01208 [Nitratireductor thuwali]
MRIAFYGSSLLSSCWNGAATYYRGMIRALSEVGYRTTFYEPDIYGRQQNRDIDPPEWCDVVVYQPNMEDLRAVTSKAADADIVVKASGVGYEDDALFGLLLQAAHPAALTIFWDVDAPATLAGLAADRDLPLHRHLAETALVLTYGGGDPVVYSYRGFGVKDCVPIYNALDPSTHHPVAADPRFAADLSLLANRLPDRETRVDDFFFRPAAEMPDKRFLLGGSGWDDKPMPENVSRAGHVGTRDHNAFNASATAVLNVSRDSMAANGFSPATRVFEAAGAGACLITDQWAGLDLFLREDVEVLVARDGKDVVEHLRHLDPAKARVIGERARARVLREHTYSRRAVQFDELVRGHLKRRRMEAAE